jgi:hypothetical protein
MGHCVTKEVPSLLFGGFAGVKNTFGAWRNEYILGITGLELVYCESAQNGAQQKDAQFHANAEMQMEISHIDTEGNIRRTILVLRRIVGSASLLYKFTVTASPLLTVKGGPGN